MVAAPIASTSMPGATGAQGAVFSNMPVYGGAVPQQEGLLQQLGNAIGLGGSQATPTTYVQGGGVSMATAPVTYAGPPTTVVAPPVYMNEPVTTAVVPPTTATSIA